MAVLYTVAVNGKVRAADLNQIINALTGVGNYPINLTAVSDASQYALDVKNAGAGGKALIVRAADGTTLFLASGTVVQAAIDGTLQTLVGLSATQTMTNKTLTAPAISAPVITGGASLAGVLAVGLGAIQESQATIASAAALALTDTANTFLVTGTTTITSITTKPAGTRITLRFDNTLTITHSASIVTAHARNITTKAGMAIDLVSDGTNWIVIGQGSRIVYATYTGNGAASRDITLGWQPDILFVWEQSSARMSVTVWTNRSIQLQPSGSPNVEDHSAIILTSTGFRVGIGNQCCAGQNDSGTGYGYMAFKA